MKTAQFTGIKKLEIVDRPAPKLDSPSDVLLRIERVGVCGSDVHYYLDGRIGDQVLSYPATLGHEAAGTVVEVGVAVANLRPGDRVAVDPAIACGRCDQCLSGRENTCRNLRFLGSPGEAPGAAAEYIVLPGRNCFPIPESMTLDEAALVEPLSVGLHAVRLAGLREGFRVAILGNGPIGLSVLLCAKAIVTCTAYATDLLDERLAVAQRCGADWTGNARKSDVAVAISQQEPAGVDVVFECSGDPACLNQAVAMLAPGGTLVLVAIPSADRVSLDPHAMRRKELKLANIRRQCGCVAPMIELIRTGRIDARPLLTHHFPLSKIADAFDLVAGYRDGVVKTMLDLESPLHLRED
jgi:L-iditol 2-dehydrogenase